MSLFNNIITATKNGNFTIHKTLPKEYEKIPLSPVIDKEYKTTSEFDVNPHHLELKFITLPKSLLLPFMWLNCVSSFFTRKYYYIDHSILKLRKIIGHRITVSDENIYKLAYIHKILYEQSKTSKYICYNKSMFYVYWNDLIIPMLQREKLSIILNRFGICKNKPKTKIVKPTNNLMHMYTSILTLAKALFKGEYNTIESYLPLNRPDQTLNNTNNTAPMVNGTACVGKSTLLRNINEKIKTEIDPNSMILKTGKFGEFKGKDIYQPFAMMYQYTSIVSGQKYYTSVSDRCIFNNYLWRFIQKYLEPDRPEDLEACVKEILSSVTYFILERMAKEPIMIILDLEPIANRIRMSRRGNGTDIVRSKIENYVPMQNVVYGIFAFLCNWPVYNCVMPRTYEEDIEKLVLNKVRQNAEIHNGLPNYDYLPFEHKLEPMTIDDHTEFDYAKTLAIFK